MAGFLFFSCWVGHLDERESGNSFLVKFAILKTRHVLALRSSCPTQNRFNPWPDHQGEVDDPKTLKAWS